MDLNITTISKKSTLSRIDANAVVSAYHILPISKDALRIDKGGVILLNNKNL